MSEVVNVLMKTIIILFIYYTSEEETDQYVGIPILYNSVGSLLVLHRRRRRRHRSICRAACDRGGACCGENVYKTRYRSLPADQ